MGHLELLDPRGLALLGGAIPLVLLYVLKVRRERRTVASTWLFAAAAKDLSAAHPWKKLLPERSLLLELAALVAFSLALARPTWRSSAIDAEVLAVVVDTSASMGTESGGTTRIELAKDVARKAVAGAPAHARAFVVLDAGTPRLLGASEARRDDVVRSIDTITTEDLAGDLGAAIALATARMRGLPGKKTLLVVTDGAVAKPSLPPVPDAELRIVYVGEPRANTGIVRVATRSHRAETPGADEVEVFVALRHFGDAARDVHVTVTLDGEGSPRASRKLLVEPGKDVPVVLSFATREADRNRPFFVRISPHDALPLDDVAYGIVPEGHAMPVVLATGKTSSWLRRALEADPDVALRVIARDALSGGGVDDGALVVVEGACPPRLPGHDALVVGPPTGPCLGVDVGPYVEVPRLTSWESADPRLRFVSLDGLGIGHGAMLGYPGRDAPLLRSGNGALALDAGDKDRAVTMLGFDVGDTDWPLRASFVLFVRNVVELARLHRDSGADGPVVTGGAMRISAPRGTTSASVRRDGDTLARELPIRGGLALLSPVSRAGVYRATFEPPPPRPRTIVANLVDPRESDVARRPLVADGSRTIAVDTFEGHHDATSFAALLGAMLILADVLLVTRRSPRAEARRA